MRPSSVKAAMRPPKPVPPICKNPYRGTDVVVFTVMVVLATPFVVAMVAEPNVHVMPGTDAQDRVTLLANPAVGVTVTITGAD